VQYYVYNAACLFLTLVLCAIPYQIFAFGECTSTILKVRAGPVQYAVMATISAFVGMIILLPVPMLGRLYLEPINSCYMSVFSARTMTASMGLPLLIVLAIIILVLIFFLVRGLKPHVSVPISAFVLTGLYAMWVMYLVASNLYLTHDWYIFGVTILGLASPLEVLILLIIAVVIDEDEPSAPASETTPYTPVAASAPRV